MPTPSEVYQQILVELELRKRQQLVDIEQGKYVNSVWLTNEDRGVYINRETKRPYKPHHEAERAYVFSDGPRYVLAKGGEGGGKSVSGIVKSLERLRRGLSGITGSPDFEHFKRSLWPEFVRWCPPDAVVPQQRYRLRFGWQPNAPFILPFVTGATLMCGGFDEPGAWEGPNVNFAHFDEARRHKEPHMIKVLDGRCRVLGPKGEPPQIYLTTTPRKNWLYEYFGPWTETEYEDPLAAFKRDALVLDLKTIDNEENLSPGFVQQRRQSLTEAEARVLLEAAWEDVDDVERFLPTMLFWDQCKEVLPALTTNEPLVIALDAATGRQNTQSDAFALVGITRHPARRDDLAIRIAEKWQAPPRQKIHYMGTEDLPGPERLLRRICVHYNVVQVCFDPTQLIDLAQRMATEELVWMSEFSQGAERTKADRRLLDIIQGRRIAHDGNQILRTHIQNADRKMVDNRNELRIVKGRGNIDLAVATSMAAWRALQLDI